MENRSFVKLRDLVGSTFEVLSVNGYKFKMWEPTEKKMLVSDVYIEGHTKKYQVETNKGQLDLGSGQLGNLLEAVFHQGKADLIHKTFEVKSNGKEGMDIRYYFNVLRETPAPVQKDSLADPDYTAPTDDVDLSSIPF